MSFKVGNIVIFNGKSTEYLTFGKNIKYYTSIIIIF